MKRLWLLLLALPLLLGRRSGPGPTIVPASSPAGSGRVTDLDRYIEELHAAWALANPSLRAYWTKPRLRAATQVASKALGVPPEWPWGVMYGESRHRPVGVFGSSAEAAKAIPSSAYGMAQMLKSRFDAERAAEPRITWSHADLLDPWRTIWTVAASYARAIRKHGMARLRADDSRLLGKWWSGGSGPDAGRRKARQILAHGSDVWGETSMDIDTTPPGGFGRVV